MSIESDKKLHISKAISVSSIIQMLLILFVVATAYAQNKADTDNLKKEVGVLKVQTIDKSTLTQMFKTKEVQIQNIAKQVDHIEKKIDENQKLLIQLLQRSNK